MQQIKLTLKTFLAEKEYFITYYYEKTTFKKKLNQNDGFMVPPPSIFYAFSF